MSKIILPLDGMQWYEIKEVVRKIDKAERATGERLIWGFKVNDALLDLGVGVIKRIKEDGFRVFADPKLFDIPNTIHNSLEKLIDAGADIISVHCSAQYTPQNEDERKRIVGISVLTSMSGEDCFDVYGDLFGNVIIRFAEYASRQKYGNFVCSAQDLKIIPKMSNTKIITPGIRPAWYKCKDDQKRVMTPHEAIMQGVDLLVIGRPILQASDIIDAIKRTNEEITCALMEKTEEAIE